MDSEFNLVFTLFEPKLRNATILFFKCYRFSQSSAFNQIDVELSCFIWGDFGVMRFFPKKIFLEVFVAFMTLDKARKLLINTADLSSFTSEVSEANFTK